MLFIESQSLISQSQIQATTTVDCDDCGVPNGDIEFTGVGDGN